MLTKTYTLVRARGIDFGISWGWIFMAAMFIIALSSRSYYDRYLDLLHSILPFTIPTAFPASDFGMFLFATALVIGVYGSVLLHEGGHAAGAKHYGIDVDGVYLWLAGGVAQISTFPSTPRKEFVITIAGPVVTAALVPVFFTIGAIISAAGFPTISWFFIVLGLFNAGMLLLNLTPAFPLDGGRLLRSSLATQVNYLQATRFAVYTTIGICAAVSVASIYFGQIGYILLGVIVGFLALTTKTHTERLYESHGPTAKTDRFRFRDQTVMFDSQIPSIARDELTDHVTQLGGAVTRDPDAADIIITAERAFGFDVSELSPSLDPSEVTIISIDTAIEYLDEHGVNVTPTLESYEALQLFPEFDLVSESGREIGEDKLRISPTSDGIRIEFPELPSGEQFND